MAQPTIYPLLKRVQALEILKTIEATNNLTLRRALEKERSEKEALAQKVLDLTMKAENHSRNVAIKSYPLDKGCQPVAEGDVDVTRHSAHVEIAEDNVNASIRHQPRELQVSDLSFSVRDAVEEIQRWLFMEGGHMKGVEELITEYCVHVRELGIPLDRLFVGGLMLHPQVSAYVWKWETNCPFDGHEIPRKDFEQKKKLYSNDEPFTILLDGRAEQVRMRASDDYIPKGCQWFLEERYQDYLALPIKHRDEFKGGMAWSTKSPNGFGEEEIEFFSVRSRLSPLCCASTPTIWS